VEDTDEQGHEAAARSQGPEVSDPAEPREGHRKSGPLGEQPGFAAAQVTASAASSVLPDDEQPATPQAVEARASARKWLNTNPDGIDQWVERRRPTCSGPRSFCREAGAGNRGPVAGAVAACGGARRRALPDCDASPAYLNRVFPAFLNALRICNAVRFGFPVRFL
jgi:hypothetical protein